MEGGEMDLAGLVIIPDARYVSLPGILVAAIMQYLRFAKKPMAAPCQRVTESASRRCVLVGLLLEMLTLRLVPLCEAYPMNASLVVVLYFWRELKARRSSSISLNGLLGELLVCFAALSPWALPFLDIQLERVPEAVPFEKLLQMVLAPAACIYIVMLLFIGIVLYCRHVGESAFGSCAAPALNFGLSALLLKAWVQLIDQAVRDPGRPELWAGIVISFALLLGVRSAAAGPLRRALEVYDNMTVLAFYGLISGGAAAFTGCFVFAEASAWDPVFHAVFLIIMLVHCWGMHRLGARLAAGLAAKRKEDEEMAVSSERGKSFAGGQQSAQEMKAFSSRANMTSASSGSPVPGGDINSRRQEATSPSQKTDAAILLPLDEEPSRHTVDEDAEFEDRLFAKAFEPRNFTAAQEGLVVGEAVGWATWGDADVGEGAPKAATSTSDKPAAADVTMASPQFDADFDEIMRRFDEDDKRLLEEGGGATGSEKPFRFADAADPGAGAGHVAAEPAPKPEPGESAPPVIADFDAQALFDIADTGQDDEEELLKGIQDISGP